jgi:hypothetical protein
MLYRAGGVSVNQEEEKALFVRIFVVVTGLFFAWMNEATAVVIPPQLTTVRLGWNAAPDLEVRGYAIYYAPTNSAVVKRVDAGNVVTCVLSNLVVGTTYWIHAVSYDAFGLESVPSNEILHTATTNATVAPAGPKLEMVRQADGRVTLNYRANPGQVCGIQFTSKLNPPHWQTLTNVTANSLSNVVALDASARTVPQRFYRVALSPQPLVSAVKITRLPTGAMRLEWNAPPLAVCRVQRASSPKPAPWSPLASNVVTDAEGRAVYTDHGAITNSSRFYRVIMP